MKTILLALAFFAAQIVSGQSSPNEIGACCLSQISLLESAMQGKDSTTLNRLLDMNFSIGHSNGFVENKKEFIAHIIEGKMIYTSFKSLDTISSQLIHDNLILVRRKSEVKGESFGKSFATHLNIMEVWIMENSSWKLLARQSVKIP